MRKRVVVSGRVWWWLVVCEEPWRRAKRWREQVVFHAIELPCMGMRRV